MLTSGHEPNYIISAIPSVSFAPAGRADLERAGYTVYEAFEVSEVLHLCEHQNIDVVPIAADVVDADVAEVQMRRITIVLKPETTSKDLIAELWQLFPDKMARIQ